MVLGTTKRATGGGLGDGADGTGTRAVAGFGWRFTRSVTRLPTSCSATGQGREDSDCLSTRALLVAR